MKKLLILILFINFAFTDEIHMTVKSLFTSYDTILEDIEIESITESRVYYNNRNSISKTLSCSVVNEMIIEYNGQRKVYEIDCAKNKRRYMIINELFGDEILNNKDGSIQSSEQTDSIMYQPKVMNIKRGRGRLGGALIAAGALFLHSYPEIPSDISTYNEDRLKDFVEDKKFQWRAGIVLISIGGVLVAMGI